MGPVKRGVRIDLRKIGFDPDDEDAGYSVALVQMLADEIDTNPDAPKASLAREIRAIMQNLGVSVKKPSKTKDRLEQILDE